MVLMTKICVVFCSTLCSCCLIHDQLIMDAVQFPCVAHRLSWWKQCYYEPVELITVVTWSTRQPSSLLTSKPVAFTLQIIGPPGTSDLETHLSLVQKEFALTSDRSLCSCSLMVIHSAALTKSSSSCFCYWSHHLPPPPTDNKSWFDH